MHRTRARAKVGRDMPSPPGVVMSRELAVSFASAGAMWALRYVLPASVVRRIPKAPTAAARSQWLADETEAATFARYGENATPAQRAKVQAECDASLPAQLSASERLRWINTSTCRGLWRWLVLCGFTTRELRTFLGLEFREQRELFRRDPSMQTTRKHQTHSKHKRGPAHGNSLEVREPGVAAAVLERWSQGHGAETIADELDVSLGTVRSMVAPTQVPARPTPKTLLTDDEIEALERMRLEGARSGAIASAFGVSKRMAKALSGAT